MDQTLVSNQNRQNGVIYLPNFLIDLLQHLIAVQYEKL